MFSWKDPNFEILNMTIGIFDILEFLIFIFYICIILTFASWYVVLSLQICRRCTINFSLLNSPIAKGIKLSSQMNRHASVLLLKLPVHQNDLSSNPELYENYDRSTIFSRNRLTKPFTIMTFFNVFGVFFIIFYTHCYFFG